jgi:hypothetical protein
MPSSSWQRNLAEIAESRNALKIKSSSRKSHTVSERKISSICLAS